MNISDEYLRAVQSECAGSEITMGENQYFARGRLWPGSRAERASVNPHFGTRPSMLWHSTMPSQSPFFLSWLHPQEAQISRRQSSRMYHFLANATRQIEDTQWANTQGRCGKRAHYDVAYEGKQSHSFAHHLSLTPATKQHRWRSRGPQWWKGPLARLLSEPMAQIRNVGVNEGKTWKLVVGCWKIE